MSKRLYLEIVMPPGGTKDLYTLGSSEMLCQRDPNFLQIPALPGTKPHQGCLAWTWPSYSPREAGNFSEIRGSTSVWRPRLCYYPRGGWAPGTAHLQEGALPPAGG